MERNKITERVAAIIRNRFGEIQVTDEMNLRDDLNADSLDLIETIIDVESEFAITISDEEAQKIRTIGDLIDYINGKV